MRSIRDFGISLVALICGVTLGAAFCPDTKRESHVLSQKLALEKELEAAKKEIADLKIRLAKDSN